jgi:hypothetical protein
MPFFSSDRSLHKRLCPFCKDSYDPKCSNYSFWLNKDDKQLKRYLKANESKVHWRGCVGILKR